MSTKLTLSEQALRIISSFDRTKDEQIDRRELILMLDQVANGMASMNLLSNLRTSSKTLGAQYLSTFKNVTITQDLDTGRWCAQLPARYLSLPDNKGIDLVTGMMTMAAPFIPIPNHFVSLYDNVYAGMLEGNIGYYPEDNIIYFTQDPGCKKLYIRLFIADSSYIDDNAEYPITPEEEIKLIDEVVKRFMAYNSNPTDKINDSIKTNIK